MKTLLALMALMALAACSHPSNQPGGKTPSPAQQTN
jgi:hypothetical protein